MPGRYRFTFPGSRGHTDPWFRAGTVDVTTTVLITALCTLSFFVWAASNDAVIALAQIPSKVTGGQVWRVLTWPIANQPDLRVAIAIAIFWYMGSQVENILGRVKFSWLLGLTAVIPGVLGVVLDIPQAGINAIELAIFVVFVCEYPTAPFFFGIPAWVLAAVIVGIDILRLLGNRQQEELVLYLAGIATAVWAARSLGMLTSLQWLPPIKLPFLNKGGSTKRRAKPTSKSKSRQASVVVDGPWSNAPTYSPMQDQVEVDKILDKIAAVGMDGLTADEKKRLNEASKRLRKNGQ